MAGKYTASFVGMFPADNPQLVILVKLDDPTKSIYGGKAAAPVSKAVLQAALAARDAALDRRTLAASPARVREHGPVATVVETAAVAAPIAAPYVEPAAVGSVSWVARLDEPRESAAVVVARRAVPNVSGMPVRRAVYELHRAGFHASLGSSASGGDRATRTTPAAGTMLTTGSRVVLERAP
jgi:cell division protein FtsI (penicillin-binding protein 3)